MTFAQSVSSCLTKYANVDGRAPRSEFWWFVLFQILAGLGLGMVGLLLGLSKEGIDGLSALASLALLLPYMAVTTRRLHDVGRNGWWQLISLTIVGVIPMFYWLCKPGDVQANQFGGSI